MTPQYTISETSIEYGLLARTGANRFTFLTKDKDFVNLSLTLGSPPRVVLLQVGNCSTSQIERIIRSNAVRFAEFDNDGKRSLLLLK